MVDIHRRNPRRFNYGIGNCSSVRVAPLNYKLAYQCTENNCMHSLQLQAATRNGGHIRKQVEYLDFVVSGRSLKSILGIENADYVTLTI